VTDTVNGTTPADDDDDGLFDAASDTFPSKFDMRDRLVAVYPTGLTGERKSEQTGKPYTWVETTTVVLDDGPEGWQEMVRDDHGNLQPNLIPSVKEHGPQVLLNHQWTAGGVVARLLPRLPGPDGRPGSQVGRINSRPNKTKGANPSWSISKPTEEDMTTARQYADVCRQARADIVAKRVAAVDNDAF